jgi:hypothetical protein
LPYSLETYGESARQLQRFLAESGMPTDVANIRREHVESWIEQLLAKDPPPPMLSGRSATPTRQGSRA